MTNIAEVTLQNVSDCMEGRELVNCICYQCDGTRQCPGKKPDSPACRA